MLNPISLTVPFYAYHRTRIFSKIYDQEFGETNLDNQDFVSFQRDPKPRVVSYCAPISETYRFFQGRDNQKIRRDMMVISFFSAFYDSIFDEDYNPSSQDFAGRLIGGEHPNPTTDLERVIAFSFQKLEESIGRDKKGLYDCLKRIHGLQIEGLGQRREQYDDMDVRNREEYLRNITFQKGSCSFLTYSFVSNPELNDESLTRDIEEIGSYLQVFDDMLDVYKDSRDGNVTLLTEGMIGEVEAIQRAERAFNLLNDRFYPTFSKQIVIQALRIMHREGMDKVRRFRQGLLEPNNRVHKIALLFK